MKNKILFFISALLLFWFNLSSKETTRINTTAQDSLIVMSSPDLLGLTNKWASEYNRSNPGVKISVVAEGFGDINTSMELGFVSGEFFSAINRESLWNETVARDIYVPVINSGNPFLTEINAQGISAEAMAQLFQDTEKMNWGTLLGNQQDAAVNFYFVGNGSGIAGFEKFLNIDPSLINGKKYENGAEMVAAIQKDKFAIGFCRLTEVIDFSNQQIVGNINLLPIDRNGNSKIDYSEKIYDDLNSFTRGVWIGKYPKSLYSNIYSVASEKPQTESELAFVKWVLTEGQQYIGPGGYCDLAFSERKSKVDELIASNIDIAAPASDRSNIRWALFVIVALLVSGFGLDKGMRYLRQKRNVEMVTASASGSVFNEKSVEVLNGLYFDKSHTWAFMEKDGNVKIGIDDFLQHVTGKITQVKMKSPGERVIKGEPVLSIIQLGKKLTVNSPVSGIILEQNTNLSSDSTLLNTSPYSNGWIYIIEPTNWVKEIQYLFMGEKYTAWLKTEFSRLKDFLSALLQPGSTQFAHVVLQDGGELADNLLTDLGPEVWEEFQTRFLDLSK